MVTFTVDVPAGTDLQDITIAFNILGEKINKDPVDLGSKEVGRSIYSILVKHAYIRPDADDLEAFLFHYPTREYRIGGKLGFGGKFLCGDVSPWMRENPWSVTYYREDYTEMRDEIATNTNNALDALYHRLVD